MEVPVAQATIRYGPAVQSSPRFSCLAIVAGPSGKIPLVREFRRSNPVWKLPGGRNKDNESPHETALREIQEETGLTVNPSGLVEIDQLDRGDHVQYVFAGTTDSFEEIREFGHENDATDLEVRLFDAGTLMREHLLTPHRHILESARPRLRRLNIFI